MGMRDRADGRFCLCGSGSADPLSSMPRRNSRQLSDSHRNRAPVCYDLGGMRIFAAMDIGTNSIRLAVVEVSSGFNWNVLTLQKQVVRLGEGEFDDRKPRGSRRRGAEGGHYLTHDAIARGALVCA